MKRVGMLLKKLEKKHYLMLFIWVLVMIWGTCRIYVEEKLAQTEKSVNNDRMVFNYEEEWDDLEELKPIFEKDFLQTLAHIEKTNQKDYMRNLEREKSIFFGSSILVNNKEAIPYKIAYFYQLGSKYRFENSIWKEDNVQYLDVLAIKYEDGESFSVSVSKENFKKIKANKEKLLKGEIKLRPQNFEQVEYRELENNSFYTYTKDAKQADSPYTYMYVKEQKAEHYYDASKEDTLYNILLFRYEISVYGVYSWDNLYETIEVIEPRKLVARQENKQLLENINKRKKIVKEQDKEKDSSDAFDYSDYLEDSIIIEGKNNGEILTEKDFYSSIKPSSKWKEYMLDPSKKAVSVKEVIADFYYEEKVVLLDKYMKEKGGMGRADFSAAEKTIVKDLEKNGQNSEYYQWIQALGIHQHDDGLIVDFGDDIINVERNY
jgi:hypothetical protein